MAKRVELQAGDRKRLNRAMTAARREGTATAYSELADAAMEIASRPEQDAPPMSARKMARLAAAGEISLEEPAETVEAGATSDELFAEEASAE